MVRSAEPRDEESKQEQAKLGGIGRALGDAQGKYRDDVLSAGAEKYQNDFDSSSLANSPADSMSLPERFKADTHTEGNQMFQFNNQTSMYEPLGNPVDNLLEQQRYEQTAKREDARNNLLQSLSTTPNADGGFLPIEDVMQRVDRAYPNPPTSTTTPPSESTETTSTTTTASGLPASPQQVEESRRAEVVARFLKDQADRHAREAREAQPVAVRAGVPLPVDAGTSPSVPPTPTSPAASSPAASSPAASSPAAAAPATPAAPAAPAPAPFTPEWIDAEHNKNWENVTVYTDKNGVEHVNDAEATVAKNRDKRLYANVAAHEKQKKANHDRAEKAKEDAIKAEALEYARTEKAKADVIKANEKYDEKSKEYKKTLRDLAFKIAEANQGSDAEIDINKKGTNGKTAREEALEQLKSERTFPPAKPNIGPYKKPVITKQTPESIKASAKVEYDMHAASPPVKAPADLTPETMKPGKWYIKKHPKTGEMATLRINAKGELERKTKSKTRKKAK